jgi:hypothetical protein
MIAENIREQIASYLAGGIELDSFEDWIAQNTWNIAQSADLESRQLAFAVELRLSEHSAEHLPEAQLRDELAAILLSRMAQISVQSYSYESSGSNVTVPAGVSFPWQFVDKISEAVSASLAAHQQ